MTLKKIYFLNYLHTFSSFLSTLVFLSFQEGFCYVNVTNACTFLDEFKVHFNLSKVDIFD